MAAHARQNRSDNADRSDDVRREHRLDRGLRRKFDRTVSGHRGIVHDDIYPTSRGLNTTDRFHNRFLGCDIRSHEFDSDTGAGRSELEGLRLVDVTHRSEDARSSLGKLHGQFKPDSRTGACDQDHLWVALPIFHVSLRIPIASKNQSTE